jgi:hypothetical protein
MTSREHTLALGLLALIFLGGGGFLAYTFAYEPWQAKKAEAAKLQKEIDDLDIKVMTLTKERPNIQHVKRASLPPDVNLAKQQYVLLMERLLQQAKITDYTYTEAQVVPNARPPVTPEIAPKKPAYATLKFTINIKKANMWQVADFLQAYYQLDLLHQITDLKIVRENAPTESRNGLKVDITSEAIILDGAEPRTALFPVTTAVAAVTGLPGLQLVSLTPELSRKLTSSATNPVLATSNRDYSLLALQDMFYGLLPKAPPPAPFAMGRLADVVIPNPPPTEPIPVTVRLSGEGSVGATITARAAGSLFTEGPLPVDPKTNTISLPAVTLSEELDPRATSTIMVEAVSADGKKQKGSFKVSLAAPRVEPKYEPPKPDISTAIKLVGVTGSSTGTTTAIIFDAANPFRYLINLSAKEVVVTKFYLKAKGVWGKDSEYEHAAGVLMISDEELSGTKRKFKVLAIDNNDLIVQEINSPETPAEPKPAGRGGMGRPGGGATVRQGRAEPLAVLTGNVATAVPPPKLYRWLYGKSLAELQAIPPEEARKIIKQVASGGPLSMIALSTSRN